jgi:hypothetical protein
MQAIKGKTSHHPLMDQRRRTEFWVGTCGYGTTVYSVGQVADEVIAEYIKIQGNKPQDDDRFRISET